MQEHQHAKEQRFLDFLKDYCIRNNRKFEDVHDDYSTGIDVYLDDKPYDLKVSNSRKLTVFKCYKGHWYCPLLEHQDIPYMYVIEEESRFLGFVINKSRLLERLKGSIETYTGDGNINKITELDSISDFAEDIQVFNK